MGEITTFTYHMDVDSLTELTQENRKNDPKKTMAQKVMSFISGRSTAQDDNKAMILDALALMLLVTMNLLGGFGVSLITRKNNSWLNNLIQPPFRPPDCIFGPVWTGLYILMAFSGWRVYVRRELVGQKLAAYVTQLVLNFLWVPFFFGWHLIFVALVDITFLLVSIVWMIVVFARLDNLAAFVLVPYLMWVSFATCLNAAYWSLNYEKYGIVIGGRS